MPTAPLPPNEARRLAAVEKLRMLGTPAEERFDKITRLAKRMFAVQTAMIDIVGAESIFVKSGQGTDTAEGPRNTSYCQYSILHNEICLVTDASKDARVSDLPYAKAIKFYAGAPLHYDGERVGVLCIMDPKARLMGDEDMAALRELADLAEAALHSAAMSASQVALAIENEQLERKALVDGLTRSWNRVAIMELLARELEGARARSSTVGVAMIDIDHFKRINDTRGHQAGDEVLRRIAARLRLAIRPSDAVGRYGGEEFLVVFPGADRQGTLDATERVRLAVSAEAVTWDGEDIWITCSAGYTLAETGAEFGELLVRAADQALYKAKREGRDRSLERWITPSITVKAVMSGSRD